MKREKNSKAFWNRYARFYDFEVLRFSRPAYEEMYRLMAGALTRDMRVLELATGTGLIAANIAGFVGSIEATDFSPKMIMAAKRKSVPANVHFSVEDATALSFPDQSFDAVIISNALHIMPDPGLALANIKRVLRPGGLLVAPTFSHGHLRDSPRTLNSLILRAVGFETHGKWTPEEYAAFIGRHGFRVERWRVLKAAFPLVYLEARLNGEGGCTKADGQS